MSKTLDDTLPKRFIEAVMQGTQSLFEAGCIAAKAIDSDPNFVDRVCDLCPDITPEFVHRMELIGRKKLSVKLVFSEAPGIRRLRKLPLMLQEKYAVEPVPVLVNASANGWEMLQMDIRNLSPDQARQAIGEDRIRSEGEQRAFIEDRALRDRAPQFDAEPFQIKRGSLYILKPCTLSRKEVVGILSKME